MHSSILLLARGLVLTMTRDSTALPTCQRDPHGGCSMSIRTESVAVGLRSRRGRGHAFSGGGGASLRDPPYARGAVGSFCFGSCVRGIVAALCLLV